MEDIYAQPSHPESEIERAITLIENWSSGQQPPHTEEAAAVIAGLRNAQERYAAWDGNRQRLTRLVELLLEYTIMDFSNKAPISEVGDEIDALAAGLNALVEEIQYRTQQVNNKIKQLDEAQRLAHMGSWEWNAERNRFELSDELVRIYGLPTGASSASYNDYLDHLHPEDREQVNRIIKQAQIDGQSFNFLHRIIRTDGEIRVLECTGYVSTDSDGNAVNMTGTAQDITERKKIEEAKDRAEQEQQRALEALHFKQQFLSNMSHEIRTPLTAIIGFTKVVLKSELDEKQRQYLNAIKVSGDALLALVNDILDYAKVNSGKMVFEETPFNIGMSIQNILQLFETKIHQKNLVIEDIYDDNIPEMVSGDPLRLNQIIMNLVGNAIKFTSEGKITVTTSVEEENDEHVTLCFSVADTGIGIESSNLSRIFESFQQASSETSRVFGGTGLGLAIVKQLVEAQHGTITAKSTVGKGSTFSFSLPFKKVNHETQHAILPSEDAEPKHTGEIRVLVVEDVGLNQLLMKVVMGNLGFLVEIAENGKVAIDKLQQGPYDIILMDLHMPVMNGIEATRYIRQEMQLDVPIIALTADVTSADVEMSKAAGMDEYVTKPINQKKLYTKMMQVLEQKKAGILPRQLDKTT